MAERKRPIAPKKVKMPVLNRRPELRSEMRSLMTLTSKTVSPGATFLMVVRMVASSAEGSCRDRTTRWYVIGMGNWLSVA